MPRTIKVDVVRQAWELSKQGKKQHEIAEQLGLAERTVQNYLSRKWLAEKGLVDLPNFQTELNYAVDTPQIHESPSTSRRSSARWPVIAGSVGRIRRVQLVWGGIATFVIILTALMATVTWPGPSASETTNDFPLTSAPVISAAQTSAQLGNIEAGLWQQSPEDVAKSPWILFHPAHHVGKVWLSLRPLHENQAQRHQLTLRWGPWKRNGEIQFNGDESVSLVHFKGDDGLSAPIFLCVYPEANVSYGQGEPPPEDRMIDINRGWVQIDEVVGVQAGHSCSQ